MKVSKTRLVVTSFFTIFLMLAVITGCKNDNGLNPTSSEGDVFNSNVGVGIFAENTGNDNTVIITNAKFVMRQLRLGTAENQLFEDIRTGPFVVYVDMYPRVAPIAVAKVKPGNYHIVKFQIHKPTPNEYISDAEFVASNGTRYSFIIKGFYNGVPFTYKSQVTAARGINIEGDPAFVSEGTTLYLTLSVNPYSWFDDQGQWLNPLNEGNRHQIDFNIKESFKRAFKDMDRNGEPDLHFGVN